VGWLLSGLIFGIVVTIVTQLVEVVAHLATPPTVASIVGGLIAHIVFFGWPIAWYLSANAERT
jgi:hypothetical protein